MKKHNRENSRFSVAPLPILPGTLVLCGCTLLLFIGILAAIYASGIAQLPGFLAGFLGEEDIVQEDDGFAGDFLASLSGSAPVLDRADETLLDLSPESLREILLRSVPSDSYYQQMDVLRTDGVEFQTNRVTYVVSGERVYILTESASGEKREIVCLPDRWRIAENGTERVYPRTAADGFTPESEAGIPSFTRMQQMLTEAEDGKYILSAATTANSPCIRVRFTDTVTGAAEVYDVLADMGVILAASSTLPGGDSPYYQMTTVSILNDLRGLDEALFAIPTP